MSSPTDEFSSSEPGASIEQAMHNQKKQEEILRKIRSQVKILQGKIFSYGMSSSEYRQILQNCLSSILNKNQKEKYWTPLQFIKAINRYVNKRPSKALKLLIEIIGSIDEQINELESSGFNPEECQDSQKPKTSLKLEGRRSDSIDGQLDARIECRRSPTNVDSKQPNVEAAFYVKLETIPDQLVEQNQKSSQPAPKRKGRPSGRGTKKY